MIIIIRQNVNTHEILFEKSVGVGMDLGAYVVGVGLTVSVWLSY